MTEGILLVDKPKGWTSFDVVNKIRRIVALHEDKKPKQIKVGHTGTLDPFATGLLVVLIGKNYTRRSQELSTDNKTYVFEAKMGEESTTGDPEGDITPCKSMTSVEKISKSHIESVLQRKLGVNEQKPPAYSAIKVDGKRAYELARNGEEVDIPARKIDVLSLELLVYSPPCFVATTEVSKGTYIRVLVEDICRDLGTCGYTTELRRTKAGQFSISDAIKIEFGLTMENIQKNLVQTL